MGRAVHLAIFAAVLPLVSASATDAGCIAHPHHSALHKHPSPGKLVHHVAGVGVAMDQARDRRIRQARQDRVRRQSRDRGCDHDRSAPRLRAGERPSASPISSRWTSTGTPVTNQQVTVLNAGAAVTVNRGADQFNYMCTSAHCETMPRPGDPKPYCRQYRSKRRLCPPGQ
jgi:hypothetical protein